MLTPNPHNGIFDSPAGIIGRVQSVVRRRASDEEPKMPFDGRLREARPSNGVVFNPQAEIII
jgi:hypothetical protein